MLTIENVRVSYGAIEALHGVSLEVNEGEIVTLIGSNGAGKSTLLNTVSGLLRPTSGSVRYRGESLEKTPPDKIVAMGICQVPEGRRVFQTMSVLENLLMGAHLPSNRKTIDENSEEGVQAFPATAGEDEPGSHHAERRRAADAGDRPGRDEQSQAAAAG